MQQDNSSAGHMVSVKPLLKPFLTLESPASLALFLAPFLAEILPETEIFSLSPSGLVFQKVLKALIHWFP